jgi:hypothetical protein
MGKDRVEKGTGQAGRQRSVADWPHIAPKIVLYITQFTPTPDFRNLERKF